ncbi:MAG: lysophospholipid acyltransferase family protein [Steroidobacteraceae bacterium]
MTAEHSENSPQQASSLVCAPFRLVYGTYAIALFLLLGLCTLLLALVVPGVQRRRRVARTMSRTFLWLAGMPLSVSGAQRLPAGQCVVVSNHASYLDGVVFTAALPAQFAFVIKREMSGVPLAGLLLRRLGSHFVERFNRHRGAADARRVLRDAINGSSLAFFPEGTFTRTPGLLKFHTGAFTTAIRAGCPIVPATVRGTRVALSPTGGLPRPGRIRVNILPPITPETGTAGDAALELRDRARAAILGELGEPDLTCSGDTAPPLHTTHARSAPASRP